jgi:hypothetical protein
MRKQRIHGSGPTCHIQNYNCRQAQIYRVQKERLITSGHSSKADGTARGRINIFVKQKPTGGWLTFDSPLNILMITIKEEAS